MGRKKKLRKEARRQVQERLLNCVEAALDLAASIVQGVGALGLMFLICIACGCCNGEHARVPISYAPASADALSDYEWAYIDDSWFFSDRERYLYMFNDAKTSTERQSLIIVKTPDGLELFSEDDGLKHLQVRDNYYAGDQAISKLHMVADLDRLDFDWVVKNRLKLDSTESSIALTDKELGLGDVPKIKLEDPVTQVWWTKSMTKFSEEEGIAAIKFLQGLANIEETDEQAKKAWTSFSDAEKENTMQFYQRLKPRPDAKEIAQELIASSEDAQRRVAHDLARE